MKDKHPAIIELEKLIQKKDWSDFYPEKVRAQMLEMWIEKWVVPVKFAQSVVDTKYLDSEFSDAIKTRLAQGITEEIMDQCVVFKTENREVSGELLAFKRERK